MTIRIDVPIDGVAVVTLDDEANRNALTAETLAGLQHTLLDLASDSGVRVVVLTGHGRVFSAGGDTRRMGGARPSPLEKKDYLEGGVGRLAEILHTYDKPLICAVNGPAVGAGMDLALWCDFRIGVASSYLRGGYIDLGLPPGFGAAWLLRQLVGPTLALDILLTGRKVTADEALATGLYSQVVPEQSDLLPAVLERAAILSAKPAAALRLTKRLVRQARYVAPSESLDAASSHFGLLQETAEHAAAVAALGQRSRPTPK
ncbi:MAG TPA: enoyl-CoA hydratase-related protein [Micromonosporaceae bacterium]|jgi:enoyl-CoA hydratase/carnithine racemase